MMERNDHDEAWQQLLRHNVPAPPIDEVDWRQLRDAVTTRAAPLLRRRATTWWQVLGAPSAAVRTLAAAAVLALVLGAGLLMPERPAASDAGFRTLEEELAGSTSSLLLAGDRDAALTALLLADQEAW
jgi:hypothetical protein